MTIKTQLSLPFITRYNYVAKSGIVNTEESKTYQECKDDCDINILYRKYLSKGFEPPNITALEQRYVDISNAKSYEDMLNIQNDVRLIFDDLPSKIREKVDYNIDTFMEVISTPTDDKDIMEFQTTIFDALGMLERKEQFSEIVAEAAAGKLPDVEPVEPVITEN